MLSSCSPRTKLCHESRAQASRRPLHLRKSKCCKSVTEEATTGVGYDGVVKGNGCVFALRDSGVLNFEYICALQACVDGFEPADNGNVVSEIDTKLDNVKGCRPSLNDGNMRASDVKFGGKRARVCDVMDKGCVFALHDLTCARQSCMEGFQAAVTLNVVYEIDIFASSDDSLNIISLEHMKKRRSNASVGHFDNEEGLEGMNVDNIVLQVETCRKTKAFKNDDNLLKAAKLHLLVFGAVLIVLSQGAEYIGVRADGPFKGHTSAAELESS